MKKIRIDKAKNLAKIYNVPPPSPKEGYELVYKFVPKEQPKYLSKEEYGNNLHDLMSHTKKIGLFTGTQKIGYILIYMSLIGGLVLISVLILYMLILKSHIILSLF